MALRYYHGSRDWCYLWILKAVKALLSNRGTLIFPQISWIPAADWHLKAAHLSLARPFPSSLFPCIKQNIYKRKPFFFHTCWASKTSFWQLKRFNAYYMDSTYWGCKDVEDVRLYEPFVYHTHTKKLVWWKVAHSVQYFCYGLWISQEMKEIRLEAAPDGKAPSYLKRYKHWIFCTLTLKYTSHVQVQTHTGFSICNQIQCSKLSMFASTVLCIWHQSSTLP